MLRGQVFSANRGGTLTVSEEVALMSFIEILHRSRAGLVKRDAHPWSNRLQFLRGVVGYDGVERITTQAVFDELEVPQKARTAAAGRTLARLMRSLGWTSVRVRAVTRGGFKEQVRGYAREVPQSPRRRQA
jgi:hypothetical protein